MQELSMAQSSLFLQAMGIVGTMGGGRVVVGSGGGWTLGISTTGGGVVEGGGDTGCRGLSDGNGVSPVTGGKGSGGINTARAEHFRVGFPDVPGGHEQTALWCCVAHSAFSPHSPG